MENEMKEIEAKFRVITNEDVNHAITIRADDVERTVEHLEKLRTVVSQIMKKGLDHDYALIPGAKRPSLLKPGAEKLMKVFGLGIRYTLLGQEVDRYENFASFMFQCDVYHLRTNLTIASCIGSANSWEKKYKERNIYKDKVLVGHEQTPVMDILNMLMKMAQKRAMVGAILVATGASNYFTQDEDEIESGGPQYREAKKYDTSKFETKKGNKDHSIYIVPCGKFKSRRLVDIEMKDLKSYINAIATNNDRLDGPLKEFVDTAREYIRDSA